MRPEPKCDCEETHVDDCPVPAWEAEYWAAYFGLRRGMSRQERVNQLEAFRPLGNTIGLREEES